MACHRTQNAERLASNKWSLNLEIINSSDYEVMAASYLCHVFISLNSSYC